MLSSQRLRPKESRPSLSTYFPKNTQYFYGYPSGEDSGFLNNVPPELEELVAMRANSCAGTSVSVINYASTNAPLIDRKLIQTLGLPELSTDQRALLPRYITTNIKGKDRNEAIKQALTDLANQHSLVMAQPYLSNRLASAYQIPANVTTWLNDKQNIEQIIHKDMLPERYGAYANGSLFAQNASKLTLPCVVKVSSSSSGDGVYICKTRNDMKNTVEALGKVTETVVVEQYVKEIRNYGLHFGIPSDPTKPIDFIGINEQLTSKNGDFLGGIILSDELPVELAAAKHHLEYVTLSKVRSMGWHGIGCFDILIDDNDKFFFVDCNFRMTGMSAYHFMVANGELAAPLLGFNGSFTGSQEEFETAILPIARVDSGQSFVKLIALSNHQSIWRFNAALMFKDRNELKTRANILKARGIKSDTLNLT